MTVGVDTYVTADEALAYVLSRYTAVDGEFVRWSGTYSREQEVYLTRACMELEQLRYAGEATAENQTLSFPRNSSTTVPDNVKNAQIELALWLTDTEHINDNSARQDLIRQGVVSFSLGELSESYNTSAKSKPLALMCGKCAALISRYMSGGYDTC